MEECIFHQTALRIKCPFNIKSLLLSCFSRFFFCCLKVSKRTVLRFLKQKLVRRGSIKVKNEDEKIVSDNVKRVLQCLSYLSVTVIVPQIKSNGFYISHGGRLYIFLKKNIIGKKQTTLVKTDMKFCMCVACGFSKIHYYANLVLKDFVDVCASFPGCSWCLRSQQIHDIRTTL